MSYLVSTTTMKKLSTQAGAYDLVCTPDWLYYRVQLSGVRLRLYAYFKHDLLHQREVSEQEFNQAKYRGPAGPYQDGEEVIYRPNGNSLRCFFQESVVREFTAAGDLVRVLPETIESFTGIYSIALDGQGHLWTAEPAYHRIAQYDGTTSQLLYAQGGDWEPGELNHPEDLAIYDQESAFLSDMGHQRLMLLNTRTKGVSTYRTFAQPVWQYRRFKQQELVRLHDGIYVL
jgi:hypothetical protein